jgi:hypothetical protein
MYELRQTGRQALGSAGKTCGDGGDEVFVPLRPDQSMRSCPSRCPSRWARRDSGEHAGQEGGDEVGPRRARIDLGKRLATRRSTAPEKRRGESERIVRSPPRVRERGADFLGLDRRISAHPNRGTVVRKTGPIKAARMLSRRAAAFFAQGSDSLTPSAPTRTWRAAGPKD